MADAIRAARGEPTRARWGPERLGPRTLGNASKE
jgi:hypothetical protein